jgi:hypothetical protein
MGTCKLRCRHKSRWCTHGGRSCSRWERRRHSLFAIQSRHHGYRDSPRPPPSQKIEFRKYIESNYLTEGDASTDAEVHLLSGDKTTSEKDDAITESHGGSGTGSNYPLNGDTTMLQGKRDKKHAYLRLSAGSRYSLQLPIQRMRGISDREAQARYTEQRHLSSNVPGFNPRNEYNQTDKGHEDEKRRRTIGEIHQRREASNTLLSLPPFVLQQPKEGREIHEDGAVAGDRDNQDSVSINRNGPIPFSRVAVRRGGVSTAEHHRVSEPMLFLQSGHGSGIAARSYMTLLDPGTSMRRRRCFASE